ncbi:MAG TPA: ABC transporter permease [Jiangellaceae bacterium]|nr:ABC transporter permease [Jiangellaceae bacterium]
MTDPTTTGVSVGTHAPSRPGREAGPDLTSAPSGGLPSEQREAGLAADAWRQLRRKPNFVISTVFILIVTSMAVVPSLWTSKDPLACTVSGGLSRNPPSAEHWFGTSILGCDYYAQAIYGARTSMLIALVATIGITVVGGTIGMLAGFFGGWTDTILSRATDIFLGLPFLLGAIVFLTILKNRNEWTLAAALIALGWTVIARIMRASVLSSKHLDYVQAARALGAGRRRLIARHILPNAVAPVVVYGTIALGAFVSAEATLTFLGVGLQPPAVSWGVMIDQHDGYYHEDPWLLAFPVAFVVGTVLSFVLVGDALRDALDPKLR